MADAGFLQATAKSMGVIFASEIGDKTFFIAALMAMRHPRSLVFIGCAGALAVMTVLSTALGAVTPTLIPKVYTHWASVILFFYFGLSSLKDVLFAPKEEGPSELEEVENELNSSPRRQPAGGRKLVSNIMIEAFTMTFLAEWGDRSQITTISLAAVQNAVGVTVGGCIGHFLCTGAAVIGGKQLASVIDERTVNIVGAVMFLIFGALAIYEGPGE